MTEQPPRSGHRKDAPATPAGRPTRVMLIVKRSAWQRVQERPDDAMHALIKRGDPTVANVMKAHREHVATVAEVTAVLAALGAQVTRSDNIYQPFDELAADLVVTVGGDGTLLHVSHGLVEKPILGVNSAPSSSVGFFCAARKGQLRGMLSAALTGRLTSVQLARMQVSVNGEVVSRRVLNDALFCHLSPAVTSRYIIEYGEVSEEHKSSGLWVGPAAGSTAAQQSAGGEVLPLTAKELQLVVREPYTSQGCHYVLTRMIVAPGDEVRIRAKSHHMRMYLDGADHVINVGLGDVVAFSLSPQPLKLLGLLPDRSAGATLLLP